MRLRPFGHWASRGSAQLRVDLKDTCGNYLIALPNFRVDGCHIAHLVYNRWTKDPAPIRFRAYCEKP